MKKNRKILCLINYEGCCIEVEKTENGKFAIFDQSNHIVDILSLEEFCKWIDGEIEFVDSKGKKWKYTDEDINAKPKTLKLLKFLMVD